MKRQVYDLFRIPYYRCMVSKHGKVIGTQIIRQKAGVNDFSFGKNKSRFILPKYEESGIPPLEIKSGQLVVYDVGSAIPMKICTTSKDGIEWMNEETKKRYVVNPKQFYLTPLDSSELQKYLESKTVEDILSDNEKSIPWWIVAIVVSAIAIIGVMVTVYMVMHGNPTIINQYSNMTQTTPIPTFSILPGV